MPNLVGIGLSQVPTNSMLGGLAYQSPDHASIKDLDLKNLSQINSEIADTAVDIFIYDTSKDSDGGAWRKRTTHTSWYNETLNTTTRGSRREFPAVAVIVAETDTLTIYDGDDPDLPMWMVFEVNTDSQDIFINDSSSTLTSIAALNGRIFAGSTRTSTTGNITGIDFIGDRGGMVYTSSSDIRTYNGGIGKRNDGVGNSASTSNWFTNSTIVNRDVNDVAMTVLPNAPIDSATGLPVPTIAVATDGGVSVIGDGGNVYDVVHTSTTYTNYVHFVRPDLLSYSQDSGTKHKWTGFIPIPTSDKSNTYQYNNATYTWYANYWGTGNTNILVSTPTINGENLTYTAINPIGSDMMSFGSAKGLGMGTLEDSPPRMIAYATTSYNTGWMHGKIKGAFLSDTDATNVTGTELVTNGDFGSGTTGWSASDAAAVISNQSGELRISNGDNTAAGANTSFSVVSGKTYVLSFTSSQQTASVAGIQFGFGNAANSFSEGYQDDTSNGSHTRQITPDYTGTLYVLIKTRSLVNGEYVHIDNVSVRLAELDRSVNNNGLQVFGTVTKSAVATGAELVAYSGFNSANYLFQPYNSDLDFTYSMMIMLWVKDWVTGDDLLHRGPNQTRNSKTSFALYCDAGYDYRLMLTTNGSTEHDFEIPLDGNLSGWQHLCFTLSGGVVRGFLNGEEKTLNQSSWTDPIFSQATDQNGLWIGRGPVSGYPTASIALLRLSASAPSPEQIKKIYEDEKVLFQENAACTLYGSSDAITALAYDEVTERLHVGTSSGRSDFQGLRRINNTTTAVTTAISAHDEFIVEQ